MTRGRLVVAAAAALAIAAAVADGGVAAASRQTDVRICSGLDAASPPGAGPVLLVFFSTDCPVCYDDLFETRYLVDKGDWPITVVGVSSGPREDLRRFLQKYAWALPVVLDGRKALFKRFKVDAAPYKALLVGEEVVYRDDPRSALEVRRKELERCLTRLFSR
jgi:cytochrome oxidase Cu insertion factor (SCO1/SenC/PrrC family)